MDALIAKADNSQKHLEDAPARLVVSFEGDMEKLTRYMDCDGQWLSRQS